MQTRSIARTAGTWLAAALLAGPPVFAASAATSGDSGRSDVALAPIRARWPVMREASGGFVVLGEATAKYLGTRSLDVQTVRLRVLDGEGRVLATQAFEGVRELGRMLGVLTYDAQGTPSLKPFGTTTLAPGDVAVALLGTLAGTGPRIPERAEISVGFRTGRSVRTTVALEIFDPGQELSWPLPLLSGRWWATLNTFRPRRPFPAHRIALLPTPDEIFISQRFAIDAVQIDAAGQTSNPPASPHKESYHAWDQEIVSAGSGQVVAVVADQPDQEVGSSDPLHPGGNYVVVQHGAQIFSVYAHMRQGSAVVAAGDTVARGQMLGRVGNSGNTSEPHLHLHFADRWDGLDPVLSIFTSQGVPAVFWNAHVQRGRRSFELQGSVPLGFDLLEP